MFALAVILPFRSLSIIAKRLRAAAPLLVLVAAKACLAHPPAKIPLELGLTLPIERDPPDGKDKTIPDYAYRRA